MDEYGEPLDWVNDFEGLKVLTYYIDGLDNPEYFDTYDEAKAELERLTKLLELSEPNLLI